MDSVAAVLMRHVNPALTLHNYTELFIEYIHDFCLSTCQHLLTLETS